VNILKAIIAIGKRCLLRLVLPSKRDWKPPRRIGEPSFLTAGFLQ